MLSGSGLSDTARKFVAGGKRRDVCFSPALPSPAGRLNTRSYNRKMSLQDIRQGFHACEYMCSEYTGGEGDFQEAPVQKELSHKHGDVGVQSWVEVRFRNTAHVVVLFKP